MAPRALGYLLGEAVLESVLELEYVSEAFAKVEEAEPKRKCFAACMKLLKVRLFSNRCLLFVSYSAKIPGKGEYNCIYYYCYADVSFLFDI